MLLVAVAAGLRRQSPLACKTSLPELWINGALWAEAPAALAVASDACRLPGRLCASHDLAEAASVEPVATSPSHSVIQDGEDSTPTRLFAD